MMEEVLCNFRIIIDRNTRKIIIKLINIEPKEKKNSRKVTFGKQQGRERSFKQKTKSSFDCDIQKLIERVFQNVVGLSFFV